MIANSQYYMKLRKKIISVLSMMCLLTCQSCENTRIITAQSTNSSRAQLTATIEGNEMMVKLTNLTDHIVAVDGDMEIYFTFLFVEKQDDNCRPKLSKGLGKPLSKRLVRLAPGESITKVFREGDIHHTYATNTYVGVDGGGGGAEHVMYTYQIPDLTKLGGIILLYNSRGYDGFIPQALATEEGIERPEDILDAAMSLEIKLANDYKNTCPPCLFRGDKDIKWVDR